MRIIRITPIITVCVGTSQAARASPQVSSLFSSQGKDAFESSRSILDGAFQMADVIGPGGRTLSATASDNQEADEIDEEAQKEAETLDTNGNYPQAIGAGMGAVALAEKKKQASGGVLRSGRPSGSSQEVEISTPQFAIDEAHKNDIMILSSDYMYVSNCLLRRRHANDPVRQQAFELFKQTAAGDWFIVFGYVCESDWSCWKKNVQNLLSKKGEEYGGGVIGRCVSRLVREKAEGLRARRRRRRRDTRSVFENSN